MSCVAVGFIASQYGMVWAMCITRVGISFCLFGLLCLLMCWIFHAGNPILYSEFVNGYLMIGPIYLVYYSCY